MKLSFFAIVFLAAARPAASFFYSPATNAERSWIFNGKHIVTSYNCLIYMASSTDVDSDSAFVSVLASGSYGCQHEGMVSPIDGRFYIYQFDLGKDIVLIYDLGNPENIDSATLKSNITGATGRFIVIDLEHSVLYLAETNVVRAFDVTNPVVPKLAATIPTSFSNAAPVRLSKNYLYHANGATLKRIDLSSPSYTETVVIQTSTPIVYLHAFGNVIIASIGDPGVYNTGDMTYWIDPTTLNVIRTIPTLYQASMKIGNAYLASIVCDFEGATHLTFENISDISSPQTIYYDYQQGNAGFVWTRFTWSNTFLFWPNYWTYGSFSLALYIPAVQQLYNDSGIASYGYIENPLVASGSRKLSGYLSEYVVLTESILNIYDEAFSLPFATIEIRVVSNSQAEKLVGGTWVAIAAGSFFTPQQIRDGSIRVNLVTNDPIELLAYQLGASLRVTLTVETTAGLAHASKSRSVKSVSAHRADSVNSANNYLMAILANRILLIIIGVVILFLLGSCIVGIRVFILPLRKKAPAKNHRPSQVMSDFTTSTISSMTSTKSSGGSTSIIGNTTLAANQTALPLALPGYQQFKNGSDFVATTLIGGGGMSEVFLGKAFNRDLIIPGDDGIIVKVLSNNTNPAMFRQEISIMSSLSRYPFFVRLLGYSEIPQTILMRNYAMGDLKKYLTTPKTRISKRIQMSLSFDVARGIRVMHKNNLAHSDIKAENILLLIDAQNTVHAVISDFGITKILDRTMVQVGAFVTVNVDGMSLRYAAPELFLNQYRSPSVICAADVYAYGVLMYFIETRTRP